MLISTTSINILHSIYVNVVLQSCDKQVSRKKKYHKTNLIWSNKMDISSTEAMLLTYKINLVVSKYILNKLIKPELIQYHKNLLFPRFMVKISPLKSQ